MVDTRPEGEGGGLLRTAISRPVTVGVGVVLIVLLGTVALLELPIQVTPEVTTPTLTISTRWRGAAPVEVESEILEPQEEALKSIENLERMISTARPDEGEIELELTVGTDLNEALVRVTNALAQVPAYPEASDEPVVSTSNRNGPPLAVITITFPDGRDPKAYRTWVEDRIVPQIERIKGVSEAMIIGGADTEIHVDFDAVELAARGLTISGVADRIGRELQDVSGGDLDIGKRRLLLRTPVKPEQPEDLEQVVLGTSSDGRTPILLGDVAEVSVGLRKATSMAMSDDRPSLILLLRRESGSNVLEVTRQIRARVDELQNTMFEPEGLKFEVVSDQVEYIDGALDLVRQNLLLGAGLAVIVLLVFLRSIGASVIIALAIPVSVFGTALGMRLFGRSINVVSLAGITFAIGMVLDNSIVVLEAIDTYRDRASSALEAAYRGVREVWGAVLASTLTTAAVFVPIITWEGEVGQLLQDVAVAVAFAVLFSFIGSVFVIPAMAALLLRTRKKKQAAVEVEGEGEGKPGLGVRLRERLVGQVRWVTTTVTRSLGLAVAAIVATVLLGLSLVPPLEYLPAGDRNLVFGVLVPPPGYSIDELASMGTEMQGRMKEHTGVSKDGVPAIERSFFVGNPERLFAGAIPVDADEVPGLLEFMRSVQSRIPGVIAFTTQASLFGNSIGGSRSIEIDIEGSDLSAMAEVGAAMMGALKRELPGAQVRPKPSLDLGAPELHAIPRRRDVAALQLSAAEIGLAVDALIDGAIVGEYGQGGRPKLDVVLRALGRDGRPITSPETLALAPVATPSGDVVPLDVVASLEETLGPTVIRRVERNRVLTMEVAPPESMPLEVGIDRVRDEVIGSLRAEGAIPAGVNLRMSGSASKLELAVERFMWVLGFGVVVLFLVMAAVFEDLLAPLAVLMALPLAAAGGILGLRLVDWTLGSQPLDLMTSVGFIILIGVVVNNAILVVDGAVARLKEGIPLEDAVPDAVRSRVRPILMTTATSLAGLLPMVISTGFGASLYRGVGAIVLGGLLLGTALTLYVIPAVFTVLWRIRQALSSLRLRSHGHA